MKNKLKFIVLVIIIFQYNISVKAQLKPTKTRILLRNGEEKFGFGKRHKSDIYLFKTRKTSSDKTIIPISKISSISFVFKEGYREFNYLKDERGKYRLLIPLIKGNVKLYKSFGSENLSKINNDVSVSYKVSKDGINYITFKNFKKEAMKFFGDCDLIVDRLKARDFFRINLAEIVIIYNNDCSENQESMVALKNLNDKKPIIFPDDDGVKLSKIIPIKLLKEKQIKIVRKKVMVNLNPIYFNLDKYKLTEESLLELDKVVTLMINYPKISIEVGSHTDSRGSKKYNLDLSKKRASEVVKYIISKGINSARLVSKGFGENKPINKCVDGVKCTELEYEINRRTEFVITNPKELK